MDNDSIDSIDKKILETKEDNRLVIIKDTKPNINKDTKPNINKDTKSNVNKDTKPNIDKDTKPNIKINKKTLLKVFSVVKHDNKDEVGWEKRKITQVFWESHVTELCEKWISSRDNYAYTRFEEFRTSAGEVLFTNEHKAVFSIKEADYYIPIKDLDIFKDFSSNSKTTFKVKPITAKITKVISAKKDKNINDSFLKENICIMGNIYYILSNYIL